MLSKTVNLKDMELIMTNTSFPLKLVLSQAKNHLKEGKLSLAKASFLKVLEQYPQNKQALQGINMVDLQNPAPLENQLNNLLSLCNNGGAKEALISGKLLAKAHPDSALVHNVVGFVFAHNNQSNHAIDSFKRAISLQPDYAEANNNLGSLLNEQGEHQKALDCFAKAIESNPDYVEAHFNLGTTLMRDPNRLEEAIAYFEKSIELRPDYAEAHNSLAVVYSHIPNKHQAALKHLEKAIELDPTHKDAINNLSAVKEALSEANKSNA